MIIYEFQKYSTFEYLYGLLNPFLLIPSLIIIFSTLKFLKKGELNLKRKIFFIIWPSTVMIFMWIIYLWPFPSALKQRQTYINCLKNGDYTTVKGKVDFFKPIEIDDFEDLLKGELSVNNKIYKIGRQTINNNIDTKNVYKFFAPDNDLIIKSKDGHILQIALITKNTEGIKPEN